MTKPGPFPSYTRTFAVMLESRKMQRHDDFIRAYDAFESEKSKPLAERGEPQRWWLDDCVAIHESKDASSDEPLPADFAQRHGFPAGTTRRDAAAELLARMQRETDLPSSGWTGRDAV